MVLALVVLLLGGTPRSLAEKALEADLIVEYELVFDAETMKTADKSGSNAIAAGGPLKAAAKRAKVARVLHGVLQPDEPPPPPGFVAGSRPKCLEAAGKSGRVRVLAFFKGGRQIYGVEQQLPTLTDLDPDYPKIVAAVEQAVKWRKGLREDPEPGDPYAQELADARADPLVRKEFKGPIDRDCP